MNTVSRFFGSICGWCMVFACLGGVGVFFPWDRVWVDPFGSQVATLLGIHFWHGGAIASTFLLLLLYLVATNTLHPVPTWRPIITFIAAGINLALFNIYGYGPGRNWVHFVGCWISFLSMIALLVASSIELRSLLSSSNQSVDKPNKPLNPTGNGPAS